MKIKDKIYQLAGDDYLMIQTCSFSTQARFLEVGLFVPLMFILCLFSSYLTFFELLETHLLVLFLSLFFAWMLTNIYRLLLYTLTRSALPDTTAGVSFSAFSLFVRIVFVCFISLLISMPIESLIYSKTLDADLKRYKHQQKKINEAKIKNYYQLQYNEVNRIAADKMYTDLFFSEKEKERIGVTQNMYNLVDTSNHYLQRLRFLNTQHKTCWFITIFFMILFNLPVYQKHRLRKSDYYERKGVVERRIVELNYYAFKKKYSLLLFKTTGELTSYSEPYEDAPYNTVKKTDKCTFLNEENLLDQLYNA